MEGCTSNATCSPPLLQGERSFFLRPGESLAEGIQDVYILSEDEGLVLRAVETFHDTDEVSLALPSVA